MAGSNKICKTWFGSNYINVEAHLEQMAQKKSYLLKHVLLEQQGSKKPFHDLAAIKNKQARNTSPYQLLTA